jgi:hypothetical protein
LVPHISSSKKDARLILALLRNALRHDPDKLTTIIHEVAALNESDRETLTRLLGETTLSSIIRSTDLVTSRSKLLMGLEHLLFDPDDSDKVGERDHLHRILERELWVFGESYHLMSSERGLTELLRNHLRLQGLPDGDIPTVRRWDGRTGRTDLHLAARFREHDRISHLIVELKAPEVTAGRSEIDQIEDYANTVHENRAFASGSSAWDVILVVTDYDTVVRNRLENNRDDGRVKEIQAELDKPRVTYFVRRWRDIIDENRRRLDFVTSVLEHDPSLSEGLRYIQTEYKDFLPDDVGATIGDEDGSGSGLKPS